MTEFPRHIRLLGKEHAGGIRELRVNGIRLRCVDVKDRRFKVKRVCLQPNANVPARVDYPARNGGGGFEYEDFISFGGHEFPRVIRDFATEPVLDFRIEKLHEVTAQEPAWFIPPSDARSRLWCPNPTEAEPLRKELPIPPEIADKLRGARAVIYGVIGTDGMCVPGF